LPQARPFVISYRRKWRSLSGDINFTGSRNITPEHLAKTCAELASNKKAEDILALDLREVSTFTDFFVICSGTSEPHLKAIAGEIEARLKEDHGIRPAAVDGFPASQWIVLDYMQVIVHVFHRDKREFYALESLWGDAPRLELPALQIQ
jgi:ribosome-associated protein